MEISQHRTGRRPNGLCGAALLIASHGDPDFFAPQNTTWAPKRVAFWKGNGTRLLQENLGYLGW